MEATCKAYKHIFVVVDAFTKYVWMYTTKLTGVKEVLDKLRIQQTNFGNQKTIISDKGAAFTANLFKDFCESGGIEHSLTTTGMPRANRQVERVNRCIILVLTRAVIEDAKKWYKFVPLVQRALNSTYHWSVATTPFQLMIGVPMRIKTDVRIAELIEENFVSQFNDERNELREGSIVARARAKQTYIQQEEKGRQYVCGRRFGGHQENTVRERE